MSCSCSCDGDAPAISCSHCWYSTLVFACASAMLTPGLLRPISHKDCSRGAHQSGFQGCACACMESGIQKSCDSPTTVPKDSRAATPIIVNTVLLNVTVRPTTLLSRPNRRFQNA